MAIAKNLAGLSGRRFKGRLLLTMALAVGVALLTLSVHAHSNKARVILASGNSLMTTARRGAPQTPIRSRNFMRRTVI